MTAMGGKRTLLNLSSSSDCGGIGRRIVTTIPAWGAGFDTCQSQCQNMGGKLPSVASQIFDMSIFQQSEATTTVPAGTGRCVDRVDHIRLHRLWSNHRCWLSAYLLGK